MKIAVFTDLYLDIAGGIPSSVKAQKESLEKLGHKVVIFCPGKKQPNDEMVVLVPTLDKFRIEGAPMAAMPDQVEKFVLEKFPDFRTFDVVHVHHEAECGIAGMRLARKFGIPLVVTMHGREDMAIAVNVPHPLKNMTAKTLNKMHAKYIPHRAKVPIDDYLADTRAKAEMWEMMVSHANYADIVLVPGMHFAKKLKKYGMIKPTVHLSNGISDSVCEMKVKPRKYDRREPLKIVWNSRLSKEKRILEFLEALKQVKGRYEVHVFGAGNQEKEAREYAAKNQLKVRFYGSVEREKIFQTMKDAHLSVMASYNFDNQAMTLLEARALGLPVMFCDPDMKEIFQEGSYICAKNETPEAMAEAINGIYRDPEWVEKASKIMIAGRGAVAQSEQTKKLIKIYQQAIKMRG